MGIYTNHSYYSGYGYNSNYRDVEPFQGDHFNYHELGIIAAVESAANRDAFMKAIALNELASVEQYGTDQVFYESVNIGGVFERIKAFFKKIIEKIHKILHTFIAQLSSWFQSSKDFAKKYEKEIIKKWGLVKNDWEFKGYKFTNLTGKDSNFSATYDTAKSNLTASDQTIADLINAKTGDTLTAALKTIGSIGDEHGKLREEDTETKNGVGGQKTAGTADHRAEVKKKLDEFRDHMDEWKDKVRGTIIGDGSKGNMKMDLTSITMKADAKSLDSKEFTEELFKAFRNGEDSKEDIKLSDVGSSANEVITYLKDYDKIKEQTEKLESAMTKSIDDLIKAIDKAQNDLINENKGLGDDKKAKKLDNELIIQATSIYQSCWGFVKESQTQAFGAMLQALKDKCAQCKEVCVKVIGSSKKMTEESYDYSNSYSGNSFNSFIENVKLV